jgi:hypothetical protein
MPENDHFDRVVCTQLNIPVSYYLVQAGLNWFQLKEPNYNAVTITIPAGNYNVNSFGIILVSLLNTASLSLNSYTYSFTFPTSYTQNQTGLYTFSVNTTSSPISFITNKNPVYEQLGFDPDSTNTFTVGSGQSTLVSTNVVKFINEDTLFIHSDLVDGGDTDILQEVYNDNVSQLSNITFLNPDPLSYSKKLKNSRSQTASFYLTDEFGNPINLNGLNLVMTLMCYKDNKFYEQFSELIKYKLKNENDNE